MLALTLPNLERMKHNSQVLAKLIPKSWASVLPDLSPQTKEEGKAKRHTSYPLYIYDLLSVNFSTIFHTLFFDFLIIIFLLLFLFHLTSFFIILPCIGLHFVAISCHLYDFVLITSSHFFCYLALCMSFSALLFSCF